MTTFRTWLLSRRDEDSVVGDLAVDVARDANWPKRADAGAIRRYMAARGACWGAREAFEEAWGEWASRKPEYPAVPARIKWTKERRQLEEARLRGLYGIDFEDVARALERQQHRCVGCTRAFSEVKYVVDHCHSTGRFRGLLCSGCNIALGAAGDSASVLISLAFYLQGR